MMYYVYIIKHQSKELFYKGLTNNLEKRLQQHSKGYSTIAKRINPFKLIHVELCKTRQEARELEKFFKSGYGRELIKEIEVNIV